MPINIFWTGSTQGSTNPISANYISYLVSVCGGSTFICVPGFNPILAGNTVASTMTLSTNMVGMAAIDQNVFIVDGSSTIFQLDLTTLSMVQYAIDVSTAAAPTFCNLACNWRSRFVVAGDANQPQNFFMSRMDDPFDWDYSATDPAAAVAGNLSQAGLIGEPIIALLPHTDDYLVVGCAHSLWMLQGDLAGGGTITRISDQIGLAGPRAWTYAADGSLYFVGSGGLYQMSPTWDRFSPPKQITSGLLNQYFTALGWRTQTISLAYDPDLQYLYIFSTPVNSSTFDDRLTGDHLVYDTRGGGFWFQGFQNFSIGPTCAVFYPGDNTPATRAVLMGSWDGFIRLMDQGALTDDGDAILSQITLGPYKVSPGNALLSALTLDLGELYPGDLTSTWHVDANVMTGASAYDVTAGVPGVAYSVSCDLDGRQKTFRQRLQGGWFSLQLRNVNPATYFSFEAAIMELDPVGRNRDRR